MRGTFRDQGALFSYSLAVRAARAAVERPAVAVFYGIRSERQLIEQLDYNLQFRWFVGLSPDHLVWDATTFTKNRERLQTGEVFQKFMTKLLRHPEVEPLLSDEHFSADGTLIEAWASHKSFRPKDGGGGDGTDFHGQSRKNDTYASATDPDCRLYRKANGHEAKLCYMGHVTMENRHGLAVAGLVSEANGTAERRASEAMLKAKRQQARPPHYRGRGQGLRHRRARRRIAGIGHHAAYRAQRRHDKDRQTPAQRD